MDKNKIITISVLFLVLVIGISVFNLNTNNNTATKNSDLSDISSTKEPIGNTPASIIQDFDELGISLEIPSSLDIIKTPTYKDPSSNDLESYTFYVQNYVGDGSEIGFQLYGLMQYDIPELTLEQFDEIKEDTENYEYIKEIDINGVHGFEAKLNGERSNYVYVFFLDGKTLRIAVSPGTKESKTIADPIIRSLTIL